MRRPARRSRRWHTCITLYALLALAWPSLGPLPWLVHDAGAHVHRTDGHAHAGDDDDRRDASPIPGSPTHPADHDCPECQVLQHLSRCLLPAFAVSVIAPPFICAVSPHIAVALPRPHLIAHLPPVRAPPDAIA